MQYAEILSKTELFFGIETPEVVAMLPCLGVHVEKYKKGSYILDKGGRISEIAFLLSGRATRIEADIYEEPPSRHEILKGSFFLEEFVCARVADSPIAILAEEDCEVVYIHCANLLTGCGNACTFHSIAVRNLLNMVATKNLQLNQQVAVLSQKNTRTKIIAFLKNLQMEQNNETIIVPMKRGEMADYLFVDRSSMSREIGKLCQEGVIECRRNEFRFLP